MTFGSAAPNWRRTRRSASSRSASANRKCRPRFAENVLDATNAFALYIDDASALAGVPQDALQMLSEAAQADGKTGYKISLQYPSYSAIVDYAHDRTLRQQVYRAYSTRASEFGDPDWNNGPLMVELLKLRREHAQLLGYKSFAEVSLVAKMAESPADVLDFLRDLARRAKPYAERDIGELREFASKHLGIADLRAVGRVVRQREIARAALLVFGPGAEAVLHRSRACWPGCSR